MNKLFNLAQAKGKWHKFPCFNLGGGAKLYKNFAQKLLAVSLCMAVVLLGTPVTTFAEDEVPVAQSVYIKATNVPELKVGEALPSLDDVQLEVTVFAPGAGSTSVEVLYLEPGWTPGDTATEDNFGPAFLAVFGSSGSFAVDDSTIFASNCGASLYSGWDDGDFAVELFLPGLRPRVEVSVVDVPDLVVGQPFPELDLAKNFAVSVAPAEGFNLTSASVEWAGWVTTSDWTSVAAGAVVQAGVSYGIGTIVVGDGAFCGGPSETAGVAGSLPVGAVLAFDSYVLSVGLVFEATVPGDQTVPAGAVQLRPSGLRLGDPTRWTFLDKEISLWREVDGVYQTQNQSTAFDSEFEGVLPNMTPCVLEVPVEVPASGGVLSFDWKVSSEENYDYLWYEVLDSSGAVVYGDGKSGEDSDFDTVELDLNGGSYTLKFTYQGDDEGWWRGADAGYVRNISFTPTGSTTPTPLQPSNLDSATGSVVYMSQNQSTAYDRDYEGTLPNMTPCVMTVPVEVGAGGAELMFDWMVSSEEDYDFLRFELKDADGHVLTSDQKSGVETAFDTVKIGLPLGNYTLTFTYQGDDYGWWAGADTGYVKNIYLVPSSGVSGISKTMFALPSDLSNSANFSLSGLDFRKLGRVSFGQRPADARYIVGYDDDDNAIAMTAQKGAISWLIAGSDAANSIVLYSEEPLTSANAAVYEYDEDSYSYPPSPGGTDSRFQPTYYYDDYADWSCWVGSEDEKASFTADWGSYAAGQDPDHVLSNHWGASNLRKVLQQIYDSDTAPYKGFFNATEKGLMSESEVKTYDMQDAEFDDDDNYVSGAKEYTTKDVLYAPRYDATLADDWEDDDTITVGAADSLTIDKARWGGHHWLRSPYPYTSSSALVALPGYGVDYYSVDFDPPSISAAFRLNLSSVLFTSAASAGTGFSELAPNTPMTLRLAAPESSSAEVGAVGGTIGALSANGWTLMVQGVTDGQNWSYSKAIESDSFTTVSAAEVAAAGSIALSSFDNCEVWLEKPVESGGTLTYAVRAEETLPVPVTGVSLSETTKTLAVGESFDLTATISPEDATIKNGTWTSSDATVATVSGDGLTVSVKALKVGTTTITVTTEDGAKTATCDVTVTEASAGAAYLEATVTVKGQQQRLRVYDPYAVLPSDTSFSAAYVDGSHGDHNFFVQHVDPATGVELRHFYNLTLTSGGQTLSQLDGPVELWFEAINGIDAPDSFISRVSEDADAKLSPTLYTDEGGVTWIKVLTDHFSPYALTDLLSDAEKAALGQGNVKTGDLAAQITVAGLGMTLVLALGIMLRLITNKKKFDD